MPCQVPRSPTMIPSVSQYAGQQLLTVAQAEAYANHFIAIHLSELPYGGVYAKISTAARENPKNAELKTLEQTSFQGTTLRGLLLEAYGFSFIGEIMLWVRSPRSAWPSSWPCSSVSASACSAHLAGGESSSTHSTRTPS